MSKIYSLQIEKLNIINLKCISLTYWIKKNAESKKKKKMKFIFHFFSNPHRQYLIELLIHLCDKHWFINSIKRTTTQHFF